MPDVANLLEKAENTSSANGLASSSSSKANAAKAIWKELQIAVVGLIQTTPVRRRTLLLPIWDRGTASRHSNILIQLDQPTTRGTLIPTGSSSVRDQGTIRFSFQNGGFLRFISQKKVWQNGA
jgi:hypothetical protein